MQWKEIAFTMRDSEFEESEEHLIDLFDIKVCPPILFYLSCLSFLLFQSIVRGYLEVSVIIF